VPFCNDAHGCNISLQWRREFTACPGGYCTKDHACQPPSWWAGAPCVDGQQACLLPDEEPDEVALLACEAGTYTVHSCGLSDPHGCAIRYCSTAESGRYCGLSLSPVGANCQGEFGEGQCDGNGVCVPNSP